MNECRIVQGLDRDERLQEIGLNAASLQEVIEMGEMARGALTRHDAGIYRALTPYGARTRHFRDLYCPSGWLPGESSNQAWTLSPDGRYRVIMVSGDASTGLDFEGLGPQPRGGMRRQLTRGIRTNEAVLSFSFIVEHFGSPTPAESPAAACTLWLIAYRDRAGRSIRCELSTPAGTAGRDKLVYYAERILLEPVPLATDPHTKADTTTSPQLLVDRRRRSA